MSTPYLTILKYHGSKSRMVKNIIPLIPKDIEHFIEAFCGSAVVSLNVKNTSILLNDLDKNIYNFFRVLRNNEQRKELISILDYTPYCQDTFNEAREAIKSDDKVKSAWGFMVRNEFSFGGMCKSYGDSGAYTRGGSGAFGDLLQCKKNNINSSLFNNFIGNSQIYSKDALEFISKYKDLPKIRRLFFYCDPPYPNTGQSGYKHKYTMDDFDRLLIVLSSIKNHKFLLSCFKNDIVEQYANDNGWYSKSFKQVSGPESTCFKTEMLYANYPITNDLFVNNGR